MTTLQGSLQSVEAALIELTKAVNAADGWADRQRDEFDRQRVQPIVEAGRTLSLALRKAQEQCKKAEQLLS